MFGDVSSQSSMNSSESYLKITTQSLWAATLQVNSHLAANKCGFGKSENKALARDSTTSEEKQPSLC